jgi:hypothetical protein
MASSMAFSFNLRRVSGFIFNLAFNRVSSSLKNETYNQFLKNFWLVFSRRVLNRDNVMGLLFSRIMGRPVRTALKNLL